MEKIERRADVRGETGGKEKMAISKEVMTKFLDIVYGIAELIDNEEELKMWVLPFVDRSIQRILCDDLTGAIEDVGKATKMLQQFNAESTTRKDTVVTNKNMGNKLANTEECVKYDDDNVTQIHEDDRCTHINMSDHIKYCVPQQDVITWDEYDEDYSLMNRHTNKNQDEREEEYHDDYYNDNNMDNPEHEVARINSDCETRRLVNATRREKDGKLINIHHDNLNHNSPTTPK